ANCKLHTLSSYDALLEVAIKKKAISYEQLEVLKQWRVFDQKHGTLSMGKIESRVGRILAPDEKVFIFLSSF
ncbi:MAG: hypothetical protein HC896_17200, partial [Bacteroidales bacterium]|nr:hypothetical protein [Bacteroidales bacterium]